MPRRRCAVALCLSLASSTVLADGPPPLPPPVACGNGAICQPTPIPPLAGLGYCSMCGIPYSNATCPADKHLACVTQPSWPPLPKCPDVSWVECTSDAQEGDLHPLYYPFRVVYAPPGRSSSITYSSSTGTGTTVSVDNGLQVQTSVSVGMGANAKIMSFDLSMTASQTHGQGTADAQDIMLTTTSGYKVTGQQDGINHDWDEVWFLVRPKIHVTLTDAQPWPVSTPRQLKWSFGTDEYTDVYFLYVGELNGHFAVPPDVQAALDGWGFRPSDLQALLKADERADPNYHSSPLTDIRYSFVGQFEYRPPLQATTAPSAQTYAVTQNETTSHTDRVTQDFSIGISMSGSVGLGDLFKMTFGSLDRITLTSSTSNKATSTQSSTDTLVVGQPAFGYTGPTVLRVYEDRMWHTYVYSLDWM